MTRLSQEKKKQLIGIGIIALLAVISLAAYVGIGRPLAELSRDTERLRAWVVEKGWSSRLIYMGVMCFQVLVAVIPGEPLELAAGYVFGALEGTLVCLGGIALGSVIVFGLVRVFGVKLVEIFFSREKIDSLQIMKNPRRLFWVTAVLMILPGTPKDLLTYCAGLTKISFGTWLLICTVGRIPSVITSTLGGHAVAEGDYVKAIVIFLVTALLCGTGLYVFARMNEKRADRKKSE